MTSASDGSCRPSTRQAGACAITADHGNAEQLLEPDESPSTFHSLNLVSLIVTSRGVGLTPKGTLADVALTVLALLRMQLSPRWAASLLEQ